MHILIQTVRFQNIGKFMFYTQNRAFEGLNTQIHHFRTCRVATAVKVARVDYVALKIMKLSHGAIKRFCACLIFTKINCLAFLSSGSLTLAKDVYGSRRSWS